VHLTYCAEANDEVVVTGLRGCGRCPLGYQLIMRVVCYGFCKSSSHADRLMAVA
jgi:hypothetical protein